MAHYAFLDDNNVVIDVITGRNEDEVVNGISDWETYYGNFRGQRCVRTSYNSNIRKQYAGIGFTYDDVADVFIRPQPFLHGRLIPTMIGKHQHQNLKVTFIGMRSRSLGSLFPLADICTSSNTCTIQHSL